MHGDVSDERDVLLIVQCDSGHLNGDLLACAKYRLDDIIQEEFARVYQTDKQQPDAAKVYQPDEQLNDDARIHQRDEQLNDDARIHQRDEQLNDDVRIHQHDEQLNDDARIHQPDEQLNDDARIHQPDEQLNDDARIHQPDEQLNDDARIYQPDALMSPGLEVLEPSKTQIRRFHVLFTVYLPRKHGNCKSSFVCFHGGEWICTHIDDFFPVQPYSPVSLAFDEHEKLLSELFRKIYIEPPSCNTPGVRVTTQQFERKEQANLKLYVHIQLAVEKAGHLPNGVTAVRMRQLNQLLLTILRNEFNKGMRSYCVRTFYQ